MAKAVVYALLTVTLVVFFFFSPKKQTHNQSIGSLISRRLGHKFQAPNFDPLVTKVERLSREKAFSSAGNSVHGDVATVAEEPPENDEFGEYFVEEGRLNTTMRIRFLFPLLDVAPKDGFVSLKELQKWMMQQTKDSMSYRTAKELDLHDKDGDGTISFSEYLPQFSKEDIERNETGHGEAGWWRQQFDNADFDHNGSLDLEEFNNFLHPEDSKDANIQRWILSERIMGMDYNGDGKLDYREFLERGYGMYKEFMRFETEGEQQIPTPQLLFAELDKNKDRSLVPHELRPILPYLQPGELSYAKYYSTFLVHEADDDKDGKLSLEEMLNHEDLFYKAVHHDDLDDDDYYDHDEL